ncbi:MAG: hypothetical protein KGI25_07895 [Thaumarchaeota archaeon]|nr:hypothetical protein [Nitrososphaerota archaeon]
MSNSKKIALDTLGADIRARQTNIEILQQAAWNEMSKLDIKYQELLRQYILENRLLDLCTWDLFVDKERITLFAGKIVDDLKKNELSKYFEKTHHSSFDLVTEPYKHNAEFLKGLVTLIVDDGEMRICFDETKYVADFVQKFGLKINTSEIDRKIEVMEDTMNTLKYLKSQVIGGVVY